MHSNDTFILLVRPIARLFASPRTTLHRMHISLPTILTFPNIRSEQRSWLKSKEESLSLPTPSCQALCMSPLLCYLDCNYWRNSQCRHACRFHQHFLKQPTHRVCRTGRKGHHPIELCIDTYIGLYVTLSGKTLSRINTARGLSCALASDSQNRKHLQ